MFPSSSRTKRYARWSLGFVGPPLSVSGTGNNCKISALNTRGQVLLEPVLDAMNNLLQDGILAEVQAEGDVINVIVSPAAEVGSFSEEERSRQVRRGVFFYKMCIVDFILNYSVHSLTL